MHCGEESSFGMVHIEKVFDEVHCGEESSSYTAQIENESDDCSY